MKYYVVNEHGTDEVVKSSQVPKNMICEISASLSDKAFLVQDKTMSHEVQKVVKDENGDPVMIQLLDENSDPVMHQPRDIDGNPIGDPEVVMVPQIEVDENGDPVMETIVTVIGKEAVIDQPAEDARVAQKAIDDAAKVVADAKRSAGSKRRALRDDVENEILAMNAAVLTTTQEVEDYLNDPVIEAISKLIQGLSFGTALAKLQASDVSAYYSAGQKQSLEDILSNGIANL